jgi:hypothetical protein
VQVRVPGSIGLDGVDPAEAILGLVDIINARRVHQWRRRDERRRDSERPGRRVNSREEDFGTHAGEDQSPDGERNREDGVFRISESGDTAGSSEGGASRWRLANSPAGAASGSVDR